MPLVLCEACSLLPCADLSDLSDLLESIVSVRLRPFCLTGLVGFEEPPLRSSNFMRLSWLWRAAVPFVRPALSACPGCGVCGRESNVYVPVLERVPGTFARGAPVLLYGISDCREYGKSGRTAVMRFAEAVRQAEIVMRSLGDGQALHSTTP